MPGAPLICSSSGAVTVFSTVKASAPGKVVVTWTVGGPILGSVSIGNPGSVMAPIIRINRLMTVLKTGLLIKVSDRLINAHL